MHSQEQSRFVDLLKTFPSQISEAAKLPVPAGKEFKASEISNIIIAGMGGSAIAGDLVLDYCQEELAVPATVHRGYGLPHFAGKKTLLIAASYSGNTEETISALAAARECSAQVVGISSGGQVGQICSDAGYPHIRIPSGLPPRQALGYLFFPLLSLFTELGMIKPRQHEIEKTTALMQVLSDRFDPNLSQGNNFANHIAQSIYHAFPVIYSGCVAHRAVVVRWRNQFNENAKCLAFSNVFPELNHNEIMGWEGLPEVNKHIRIVLLRSPQDEHPRISKRIEISKELIRQNKLLLGEIFAEGKTPLERLFSLIYTGDWASYYLSVFNKKNPFDIGGIDFLKQKLSES